MIETIKVNISLGSPVSGKLIQVNPALDTTPEVINQDPYEQGWMAILETSDWEADQTRLLDAQAYFDKIAKAEVENEVTRMTGDNEQIKVVIVPCSGIGKTYGSCSSRKAAYVVTEETRPEDTQQPGLRPCRKRRSGGASMVSNSRRHQGADAKAGARDENGQGKRRSVARDFAVLDVYRRYKQFKPQGISEGGQGGLQLAQAIAQEIAVVVDSVVSGTQDGGRAWLSYPR